MPINNITGIDYFPSDDTAFPEVLRNIPAPPKGLYCTGDLSELLARPCVAIVGSRKISPYGRAVTEQLARQLSEQGIIIVSGLAFGVDITAHRAALAASGGTIAVLPSSVEEVYPASHRQTAKEIVERGGALVSEYPKGTPALRYNFVARNRLIAGLADVILITEAALKSGSLHTARFALEQGKDVLAVPGPITSATSEGTNNLIKAGATPVTSYLDVLHALGINEKVKAQTVKGSNEAEQTILDLIAAGISDGEELQTQSQLGIAPFNQTLTMLEITGKVRSLGANHWAL